MTQRGTSFKYSLKFLVVCASNPYRLHTYIVTSNPNLISVAVGLVHMVYVSYKMHSNPMQ
jgi:hypothetical protein